MYNSKPSFGQSTPGFGGFSQSNNMNSFGQSAFSKRATGGFGGAPIFGSGATGSMFNQQPAAPSTGLFGQAPQTNTFGSTAPGLNTGFSFGQNTSTGSVFGSTPAAGTNSLFNAPATSQPFGAQSSGFSFGGGNTTGSSFFGSSANTGTSLFNQPAAPTAGSSVFGASTMFSGGNQTGSYIPFKPVNGTDMIVKNNHQQQVNTMHHCITCMPEYENKSLEELRMEDYAANRKGGGAAAAASVGGGMFGAPAAGQTGFGQPGTSGGGLFGAGPSTGGAFGQTAPVFGQPSTSTTGGLFDNKPSLTGFGAQPATGGVFSFGATNTNTGGSVFGESKPFGAGLFGQQPQTSAFSTTQPTNTFGPFGQTQQSAPLFGDKSATTGFGMPQTSTNFGSTFGNTLGQTGGSIFDNKNTTTPFGSTAPTFGATNTFGAGASTNTGTNLFGGSLGAQQPASTGAPTFGFNTSSSNTFGGGLNLSGGNLFSSKPAGSNLFGGTGLGQQPNLFGNTNTAPQLGQTNTLGTSAFGATGGLGGFGTSSLGTGGSVLGGGLNLGSTFNNNTSLGFLGNNNNNNNNPSNANNNNNIHEQIIALLSRPYGNNPLFKDLVPKAKSEDFLKPTNPIAQKAILESDKYKVSFGVPHLRVKPISSMNKVSKKSLFGGLEEDDPSIQAFSLKRNVKRLVLRPKQTNVSSEATTSPQPAAAQDTSLEAADRTAYSALGDSLQETPQSAETSPTSNIQRRVGLSSPRNAKELFPTESASPSSESDGRSWLTSKPLTKHQMPETPHLESTYSQLVLNAAAGSSSTPMVSSATTYPVRTKSSPLYPDISAAKDALRTLEDEVLEANDNESERNKENYVPHPTGIKLTRPGYYTIPSLDELISFLQPDGRCLVSQFTVGRRGYGNIYFDCDEMDVAGLDLDEIVHFQNKVVIVYPDDEQKPPLGSGLNRRAQVTLDKVWPMDKSLREPITSPDRLYSMDFEGKLRRVCDKVGTKFIEYRPQTGSWVFKVHHFSKYGLPDSDNEDSNEPEKPEGGAKGTAGLPAGVIVPKSQAFPAPKKGLGGFLPSEMPNQGLGGFLDQDDQTMDGSDVLLPRGGGLAMDTSEENSIDTNMYSETGHSAFAPKGGPNFLSPMSRVRSELSASHTLQLMKASFYNLDNDMDDAASATDQLVPQGIISGPGSTVSRLRRSPTMFTEDGFSTTALTELPALHDGVVIQPVIVKPKSVMLHFHKQVLPFKKTIAGRMNANCYADLAVANARLFRVGWGAGGHLTALTTVNNSSVTSASGDFTTLHRYLDGRGDEDTSPQTLQRLHLCGPGKDSIEKHLEISLKHSTILDEDCPADQCPRIVPTRGMELAAAEEHLEESTRLYDYNTRNKIDEGPGVSSLYWKQVWSLCIALWGQHFDSDADMLVKVLSQHAAVSRWLYECCATEDLKDVEPLIALLAQHRLQEACTFAQKDGNYMLALIISQIGGDSKLRALALKQLYAWRDLCADKHVDSVFLAAFSLVAGRPLFPLSTPGASIHVCEGLPWLPAFALFFWYLCDPVSSVQDAVQAFERSFFADCRIPKEVSEDRIDEDEDPDLIAANEDDIVRSRVAFPAPVYSDRIIPDCTDPKKRLLDMRYQLLALRASSWRSLDSIVNPASHTPDPLDHRLSWLVMQFLESLNYSHWSPMGVANVTEGFAAQLEAMGLWQWAVYVLQHIPDDRLRNAAVLEIVMRHAGGSEGTPARDLLARLKVPQQWIYRAEALKAKYMNNPKQEARNLTLAGEYIAAHDVIVDQLAPSYILNENMEGLRQVLLPLAAAGGAGKIPNWPSGGHLYLEFLHIWDQVKGLVDLDVEAFSYQCEGLKPRIAAACATVAGMSTPSFRHIVAKCEVGARLAQVGCAVGVSGGGSRGAAGPLISVIEKLDLPADYTRHLLEKVSESLKESEGVF